MKPADLYKGQICLTSESGSGTMGLEKSQIYGFEGPCPIFLPSIILGEQK